jgi:hypothetical protein
MSAQELGQGARVDEEEVEAGAVEEEGADEKIEAMKSIPTGHAYGILNPQKTPCRVHQAGE